MAIINCTPHPINVKLNGEVTVFTASGFIARVGSSFESSKEVGEFASFTVSYGEITGLPVINNDDYVIVSSLVLEAAKNCKHPNLAQMVAPATGHPACTRNEKGHIESVPGFVRA